jgi:hypothetical protein
MLAYLTKIKFVKPVKDECWSLHIISRAGRTPPVKPACQARKL